MQAEQIAKALGNAKRVGKGWLASCPLPTHGQGHGDKNPSLSISDGDDGKPLFKCHSGCDQHEVFAVQGVSAQTLAQPPPLILDLEVHISLEFL